MPFPFRLERRHVDDDPAARVGRLAETDRQNVARDPEVLESAGQREGIRRDDADVRLDVHEGLRVEVLRIDDGVVDVGEDLELVADADVVTVRREAVRDDALAHLIVDEGFDHPLFERHALDPGVVFDGHDGRRRTRDDLAVDLQ